MIKSKVEFEVARVEDLLCCSHQCVGHLIFINSIKSFLAMIWIWFKFHSFPGEAQTLWDKQEDMLRLTEAKEEDQPKYERRPKFQNTPTIIPISSN